MDEKDYADCGVKFVMDGDQWCCVFEDFVDLAESPSGFGDTKQDAYEDLIENSLK